MIDAGFTSLPAHHAIENILDKRIARFVSDFKNTSETTNTLTINQNSHNIC